MPRLQGTGDSPEQGEGKGDANDGQEHITNHHADQAALFNGGRGFAVDAPVLARNRRRCRVRCGGHKPLLLLIAVIKDPPARDAHLDNCQGHDNQRKEPSQGCGIAHIKVIKGMFPNVQGIEPSGKARPTAFGC